MLNYGIFKFCLLKDVFKCPIYIIITLIIGKVSKRNIEALGKVQFSTRIDFSADGGLRIGEIQDIDTIESYLCFEYELLIHEIINIRHNV